MLAFCCRPRCAALLILAAFTLAPSKVPGQEAPPSGPQALVLTEVAPNKRDSRGILVRELVRQAVLITAREEYGLLTRDATLGESLPAESKLIAGVLDVNVRAPKQDAVEVQIQLKKDGQLQPLDKFTITFDGNAVITDLTSKVEEMTRTKFVGLLEKAGVQRQPHTAPTGIKEPVEDDSDDNAPAENPAKQLKLNIPGLSEEDSKKIKKALNNAAKNRDIKPTIAEPKDLNPIPQFVLVRKLHTQLRQKADSPQLLAELAKAYANLGMLTELNWSPAHKVFKARALLYAERLHVKSPDALSLATRGYVRGLIGLPLAAIADLKASDELGKKQQPPQELSTESKLMDAYCQGDSSRLSEMAKSSDFPLLAKVLLMLNSEGSSLPYLRHQFARSVLESDAGNVRAWESLGQDAEFSLRRQVAAEASNYFVPKLYVDLQAIEGLSKRLRNSIEEREPLDGWWTKMADLTDVLLANSGNNTDVTVREDPLEPSLLVVGGLVRDINFLHAWREIDFQRHALSIDTDDSVRSFLPMIQGHRYQDFIESHVWDEAAAQEKLESLLDLEDDPNLEASADPMIDSMLNRYRMTKAIQLRDVAIRHDDLVLRDLIHIASKATPDDSRVATQKLQSISPMTAVIATQLIAHAWDVVAPQAEELEKRYADEPMVQDMLARRYETLQRVADAMRCLQKRIDKLPDANSYKRLADMRWMQGDENGWVEMLEKSLEMPTEGFEGYQTHAKLSDYFKGKKKLDKALEHAKKAAESGAAWANNTAIEAFEMNGMLDAAEKLVEENAGRYRGMELEWYFWCRRTGSGNLTAARKLGAELIEQYAESEDPRLRTVAALWYYSEEKDDKALEILESAFKQSQDPATGMLYALLADETGETELRDKLFDEILQLSVQRGAMLGTIVRDFKFSLLPEGAVPLDSKSFEFGMHLTPPGDGMRIASYVGRFLYLHGREEEGLKYLQLAASSPKATQHANLWAGIMLARRDVPRQKLRPTEWAGDDKVEEVIEELRAAMSASRTPGNPAALAYMNQAVGIDPNSTDALMYRAMYHAGLRQFDKAIPDLVRCRELAPKSTFVLHTLGHAYEQVGNYAAAIEVHEQSIKLNPHISLSYKLLADMLSTVPDDKLRDGKRALEYAKKSLAIVGDGLSEFDKRAALASALAETGEVEAAVKEAERAVELAPPHRKSGVKRVLDQLKQGKPFRRPEIKKVPEGEKPN